MLSGLALICYCVADFITDRRIMVLRSLDAINFVVNVVIFLLLTGRQLVNKDTE